jgi:hypothetical protein
VANTFKGDAEVVLSSQLRSRLRDGRWSDGQISRLAKLIHSRATDTKAKNEPRVTDRDIRSVHDETATPRPDDVVLLLDALLEMMIEPRFATGREIYQRVAHDRPASAVATSSPRGDPHHTPSYREALHGDGNRKM